MAEIYELATTCMGDLKNGVDTSNEHLLNLSQATEDMWLDTWVHVVYGGEMMGFSFSGTTGTRNDSIFCFHFHEWVSFMKSGENLDGTKYIDPCTKATKCMLEMVGAKLLGR